MMRIFLITLCIGLFSISSEAQKTKQRLTVKFTDIEIQHGEINIAIYSNSYAFPNGEYYWAKKHKVSSNSETIYVDLPPGEYAIAAFQDLNGNEKLDKKMFGIPKEPYSFSGNANAKYSAPKFSDCSFIVGESDLELELKFIKWS